MPCTIVIYHEQVCEKQSEICSQRHNHVHNKPLEHQRRNIPTYLIFFCFL
jgi:hypothetical protein